MQVANHSPRESDQEKAFNTLVTTALVKSDHGRDWQLHSSLLVPHCRCFKCYSYIALLSDYYAPDAEAHPSAMVADDGDQDDEEESDQDEESNQDEDESDQGADEEGGRDPCDNEEDTSGISPLSSPLFLLQCAQGRRETGEFFETDPYALGRAQEGVAQLLNRMSDVDDECDLLREQIRARGEELAKHAVSKSDQTLQSAAMDVDGDKVSDPGQTENAPSSPRIANASALAEWLKQHPDSPEASGHAAMLTLVPRYDGRHKPKRQRRKAAFLAVLSLLIVLGQYAALLKKKRLQIASVAISSLPVETLGTRILAIAQHLAAKGVTIALADDCGQYCRMFAEAEVRGGSPQFFPDMLKELLSKAREVCEPTLLPYT
ncbi:hypothetical protein C8R46DRAFT_1221957 [Mycena filopes]|nr:hypothetical protein C8R46DRAFT_1221957 [Mycena filopes]